MMGKKVLIMGLGLHGGGLSSALFFMRAGKNVFITDLRKKSELQESINVIERVRQKEKLQKVTYVLGKHRASDFKKADVVIRNPAVPNDSRYLKIARSHNIPVNTDISYFLSSLPTTNYQLPTIIGITGTKGKSTTATLLHHVLTECGESALLAGNIRKSPLDYITITPTSYKLQATSYIVLELSSWHLESLNEHTLSPRIAIITNILPDHLNRYKNFNAYARAKVFIFKHQKAGDVVFLNKNDSLLKKIKNTQTNNQIIWFAREKGLSSSFIHPDTIAVVKALGAYLKLKNSCVDKAIASFSGLSGRLQQVALIKGVTYYNDTCATQPDATIFGIKKIRNKNIILIAGGSDKNLSYAKLAKTIKKYCNYVVIYKGTSSDTASDKMIRELQKIGYKNFTIKKTLAECVKEASLQAKRGGAVLFSPAASSFGKFKHEFDRGDQFEKSVHALI